ncbi:MAG: hypothetical protein IKB16_14815 [Lentisphaeria bacterium]|nr:hypothetical protein [Lentisphaeria bacterium]
MMKTMISGFVVFAAAGLFAAENLAKFADCEDPVLLRKCGAGVTLSTVKPHSGKTSLCVNAMRKFIYSDIIKIDPTKKYKFSIYFRTDDGSKAAPFFAGLQSYDKNMKPFGGDNVRSFDGTLTTVTADARKGEQVLQVENASKYKKGWIIALDAKEDYSDLPNRNLIGGVKAINGNELTLAQPLKQDVAAGTQIRQHIGGWQYNLNHGGKPGVEWKEYSCIINGRNDKNGNNDQFWPGTQYVKIVIAANMAKGEGAVLYIDDFQLTEIGPATAK